LSIGIILKTYIFLRIYASTEFPNKNSIIPSMINDAFDSPGCTLEDIIIDDLSAISS
jgi:hypothetical protein